MSTGKPRLELLPEAVGRAKLGILLLARHALFQGSRRVVHIDGLGSELEEVGRRQRLGDVDF
jgi:hypothetical protein